MGYTHGTSIESKTRICTKCGKEFPNTNEFFSYANKKLGRLNALCKECQKIINKEKRLKIIEKNKNKDLFYSGTRHCKNAIEIYQTINYIFLSIYLVLMV